MARMNKARLLKLADFLAALKDDDKTEFDMGSWGHRELVAVEEKEPELLEVCANSCDSGPIEHSLGKMVYECKTTACAMGWGTQIPSFQRAGLTMDFGGKKMSSDYNTVSGRIVLRKGKRKISGDPITIAEKFFGISHEAAGYLFGGDGPHNTAKQAAKEIRKFVDGKVKTDVWNDAKEEYVEAVLR